MKQAILSAVFIIAVNTSFATPLRNWSDSSRVSIPEPAEILSEIVKVTGLQSNFELKAADVLNIEASISHKKRYILYNPSFINWINSITKDKWAVMALLAHEIGHHLNGHTMLKTGSTPELELEADQFAGFVLHKLGASLEQAQEVMKHIAKTEASKTHPGRSSRMAAIQTGWTRASGADEIIAGVNSGAQPY
ncbi:MAG: M48 family metalloprotease [Chitinophagales bacterium]